jgi:hypothetical protein
MNVLNQEHIQAIFFCRYFKTILPAPFWELTDIHCWNTRTLTLNAKVTGVKKRVYMVTECICYVSDINSETVTFRTNACGMLLS